MFAQGDLIDGKYEVVRLLGTGGMGAVYEALHMVMARSVAVKVLLAGPAKQKDVVTRFVNEARAAAIIGSDHIVEVFDAGMIQGDAFEEDGVPYLVMELLTGRDLRQVFEAEGALDTGRAVDIAIQACEGLAAAHRQSVVHRDLKPSNIYLVGSEPAGEWVKIVDFGIAKFRDPAQTGVAPLTADGATLGTPRYMAPEQLGSAEKVDHRADIYSLGLILYEALTGAAPFGGGHMAQLLARAARERPTPPRAYRPELPEHLEAVILRAIAPEPEDRFATMDELRLALEPFRRAHGGALAPVQRQPVQSASTFPSAAYGTVANVLPVAAQDHAPSQAGPRGTSGTQSPVAAPRSRAPLVVVAVVLVGLIGIAVVTGAIIVLIRPDSTLRRAQVDMPQPVQSTQPAVPVGNAPVPTPVAVPLSKQPSSPTVSPEVILPYEQVVDASVIDPGQAPALGPAEAPVVIYEFTDYQCAPCNRAHATAKMAWEGHRDSVRLVVFNYPIDIACNPRVPVPAHDMACQAASAAICAEEQGRFWETSDELHRLATALDPLAIRSAANSAGLDMARYDRCMLGERPRQRITHDLAQAARFNIDLTPVFIINGRMMPGDPGPRLEAMIQYLIEHDGQWGQTTSTAP